MEGEIQGPLYLQTVESLPLEGATTSFVSPQAVTKSLDLNVQKFLTQPRKVYDAQS